MPMVKVYTSLIHYNFFLSRYSGLFVSNSDLYDSESDAEKAVKKEKVHIGVLANSEKMDSSR